MDRMKFYSEDEALNQVLGEKGTPARDKYEEDMSAFLVGETIRKARQSKNMTQEELYNGYLWVYEQVYSFKNILRRMPRSLKQVPAYLMFNFFYRKWGRFTDWLCKKITYEGIGYWGERLSKYI